MNMLSPITAQNTLTRTEVVSLVALAARTVPPLWPLTSAIAVNPLAGFEELPFREAVSAAAEHFGARQSLPLTIWRKLLIDGRIDERTLRDAAIHHLGGSYRACAQLAPGVTALDLLMARLLVLGPEAAKEEEEAPAGLTPASAFVAKWCAAFFDHGIATLPMPHRELGLYRAVLALAPHDPDYAALTGEQGRRLLLTVPRDSYEAIAEGLAAIDLQLGEREFLADLVARLPGWSGHVRWRTDHADRDLDAEAPATMADLLALWMLLVRAGVADRPDCSPRETSAAGALSHHFSIQAGQLESRTRRLFDFVADLSDGELGGIFMQAAEWTYANALVPQLEAAVRAGSSAAEPPAAQLVFCIDVRSEPFRRALEAQGKYQTFGYAGFFGLPIALHPIGAGRRSRLLPVLMSPQHDVTETVVSGEEEEGRAVVDVQRRNARGAALFSAAKTGPGTSFATAEATGPFAALAMAVRTLAPRASELARNALRARRSRALRPSADASSRHAGITLDEKVGYAAALFHLTGLGTNTARLVVLTAHGGSAVNNPYAAALDCGACGGHAGGSNARLLAAMLNDPQVRSGLAARGKALPSETLFLAAEHNTTTDEVTIFDTDSLPETHQSDLRALVENLAKAAQANRAQRGAELGRSAKDLLVGASHWGEVRPEWGLARNASFIVGPRWITEGLDLDGRSFLHSYDWQQDENGSALATILTAPMVVAQWINCQYLFSTVDNHRYGSGDKVTHNVMGGIGVVQGNGGDLRIGLPRQSLFTDEGEPFHTPQRLLTIVLAPPERVETIVEANDVLGQLFGNGWVQLVVIDPSTGRALRWRDDHSHQTEGASPLSGTC